MAIQFFCSSCQQPIEVDNDAANQSVTCPYCRQVVGVPAESDPAVLAAAKSAPPPPPPVGGATGGPAMGSIPAPVPAIEEGNKLSWAALVCTLVTIVCIIVFSLLAISVASTLPPNPTREQLNEALKQRTQGPGMQALSILSMCVMPVMGIGLGIAAIIKRTKPLWPAIVALSVFALLVIVLCAGSVAMMSAATAAKTGH